MMLPFIVEQNEKLELNEEVLNNIKNSKNPRFILFYGDTRIGKSTTLNQLIRENKKTLKFVNSSPFKSLDSAKSITKGCNIYGPIKASELKDRHNLSINLKEDFDVFFCDTEGIASLDGIETKSIPGILTLLQISTISVYITHNTINSNHVKDICSQIQLSKIIKKSLIKPVITIYISSIFINDDDENEELAEKENGDLEEYQLYKEKYKKSIKLYKSRIFKEVNKNFPELDLLYEDFEIVPGGPYQFIKTEPNPDNLEVKLYWDSIQELMLTFFNHKGNNINPEEIVDYIKILFGIFSLIDTKTIKDNFNIENVLKNLLTKSFEKYSNQKYKEKIEKIKEDIKINFNEYIDILKDDKKAKDSLNSCLEKTYAKIYKKLIPDKIKGFMDTSIERYRNSIKNQIDEEFDSICNNLLSEKNINSLIEDILLMIKNSEFKEDINMNLVDNYEHFWNQMYEKNIIILNYFKDSKPGILDNLKENFISKIKRIFQNLLFKKKTWSNYLKDALSLIQKKINESYIEMLNKCDYQEDLNIFIEKDEIFYLKIENDLKNNYFKNVSEKRFNEAKENIKKKCQEEYIKILDSKLPIWKDIKSDIYSRIRENIEAYIFKIFNKKTFKDEIDINLGKKEAFLNNIPSEIKENTQIKESRKNEIKVYMDNEIDNSIKTFNNKLEKMPLFKDYMQEKIKLCYKIVDNEIKKLIDKFHYLEDKIIFNSDSIFALLTNSKEFYKDCGNKLEEINKKIRELSNEKSKEYDELVLKTKPEWNKIKSEKIEKIREICKNFEKKSLEEIYFQEDLKVIDEAKLKSSITQLPDLYKEVDSLKKKEIDSEIEILIENTTDKIKNKKNSLQNWSFIKTTLIQRANLEILNKSKNNLGSTNMDNIINILCQHVENLPNFFDICKTEVKKNEIREEIRKISRKIAKDYIDIKEEEERKRKQEEERRRQEEERRRQEEIRRQEEERRWQEERRRQEEERRWQEERRRQEEIRRQEVERRWQEERKRQEEQLNAFKKYIEEERIRQQQYSSMNPNPNYNIMPNPNYNIMPTPNYNIMPTPNYMNRPNQYNTLQTPNYSWMQNQNVPKQKNYAYNPNQIIQRKQVYNNNRDVDKEEDYYEDEDNNESDDNEDDNESENNDDDNESNNESDN